ncbi:MAG: hypothetical protein MUP17_11665 [candidate division Zixibacteria bacterium]|nr:hypothetical protein [candidate division Zixibacteria bacterium]
MGILTDIYKFFLTNANFALFIATLLLVMVTFLYVLYTKKMAEMMVKQADETKKMADIMVREYELKTSPVIEFQLRPKTPGQVNVSLYNRGFHTVEIKKVVFEWWDVNSPDKKYVKENEINKMLNMEEPIKTDFVIDDGDLKNVFPEYVYESRIDLFRLINGLLYANCLTKEGKIQRAGELKIKNL